MRMFVLEEQPVDYLNCKDSLVFILQSINEPKVAAENHPAEPTQAFVFTMASKKRLETRIVLYLTQTCEAIPYTWDGGTYDAAQRALVEEAALDFVEGMGFMMDNLGFSKLPPEQKTALLAEIPIFQATAQLVDEPLTGEIVPEEVSLAVEEALVTRPTSKNKSTLSEPVSSESVVQLESLIIDEPLAMAPAKNMPASLEDSSAAIDALDAEFQRNDVGLGDELESIFSALDSGPSKETAELKEPRTMGQPDNERWKAWIRLMASF